MQMQPNGTIHSLFVCLHNKLYLAIQPLQQLMFIDLAFIFFSSLAFLFILRKIAKAVGLVDQPNERKHHAGQVPLIGGISICLVIIQYLNSNPAIIPHSTLYGLCICLLTTIGALDDKYDISFKLRFFVQGFLSIVMMYFADITLLSLGDILGTGQTELGKFGYVVTMLAVIGAINAFNMVDGIDGLLGGLSCVTFGSLGTLLWLNDNTSLAYFCLIICTATLPYILFNLGAFGKKRKVFMGDAGSMLIGFTVIWLLLISSQDNTTATMRPVTALWLIAIPLMDMTAVMMRRIKRKSSPFKPDREHLHHIFQRIGLNSTQTLIVICAIALLLSSVGMLGEYFAIPESTMFYAFLFCFAFYIWFINSIGKFSDTIRRQLGLETQ